MLKHKVENLLNTQLVLEDLGITLAPRGGLDSTKLVDSSSVERSKSIKQNAKYIRVTKIVEQPSARPRLWGVNPPKVSDPAPEPVAPPLQISIDSSPQLKSVVSHVEGLDKKVDEVIRMLRLGITVGSGTVGIPTISTREASTTAGFEEPIFLPTSITPAKVGESNVHVESQTSESSTLDEAAAALKSLKKSKKV